MISQKINQWLNDQKKRHTLKVSDYNLNKLKKWRFDKIKISSFDIFSLKLYKVVLILII